MNDTVRSFLSFQVATLRREQQRDTNERNDHQERADEISQAIAARELMIADIQQALDE